MSRPGLSRPYCSCTSRELKMTKLKCVLCWPCLYSLLTIIAFGIGAADATFGQEKPAEPAVEALNNAVLSKLPFNKQDDFQGAAHGFIATLPDALVTGPNGIWSGARVIRSSKSGTRHVQSQPLAAGTAQPSARAVQGRRGVYQVRGRRPFQHDHSGRRYGIDRGRYPSLSGNGEGRAGPVLSAVVRQRLHDLPGAVDEQFCHRAEIALLQCDQTDWPARLG